MRFLGVCLSLLMAVMLIGAVVGGLYVRTYTAPGPLTETKTTVIERGKGVSGIASQLESEGIIPDALLFRLMARVTGHHRDLKAGEYEFAPAASTAAILEKIASGETLRRQLTVREGLTSYQVVNLLNAAPHMTGTVTTIPPEGSLLPETFAYTANFDRTALLRQMQDDMKKTIDELWPKRAANLPYKTKEEALVMASIVEKETGISEERHRVAGVFVNRLKRGMPLQTDPTVIYALTGGKMKDEGMGPLGRRLLKKDLEFDSPYNTYLHAGLPPGPIANPGRASIEAALNPDPHDYVYFVADGSGGHVFAKTLEEHTANVKNWRQIRKEKEKAQ